MNEQRFRRVLLGGSLLALAVLVALGFVLWRTLPPLSPRLAQAAAPEKPFKGVPALPSALPEPRLRGVTVALLSEPENVRVTPSGYYEKDLKTWRELLTSAGAQIVAPEQADVLVLPEARCLGPIQRRQIAAHLTRGGGIVATGALGAFDGVCKPLRDTLLTKLIGGKPGDITPAPRKGDMSYYTFVLGETVLGAGVAPGARIELAPANQIAFRHTNREVFYADYERKPLNLKGHFLDAAAVRSIVGSGRVAAFGYSIQSFVDEWSRKNGELVLANAVRWASNRTTFQLAPWPNGKEAAAVIAQDVEADYHNARFALDALEKYDLPGTAFIVGSLAQADPETTRRLIDRMEIGTHTQNHLPLDTLSHEAQLKELDTSKRIAERLAGRPVTGFRPPEERFDFGTVQIWADLGGDYIFGSNQLRSAAPEIIPIMPDSIIMLGRVSEDDFEMLSRDAMRDRSKMSELLVQQVGESVAFRGLYMFSYHSHMFSQEQLVPVLEALADKLKKTPSVWTTTCGEVARWWRARAAIDITPSPDGRTATLHNRADRAFTGGVMLVDLPGGRRHRIALPPIQAHSSVVVDSEGRVSGAAQTQPAGARAAA